ncbi:MAG TPA: hypothetical protein VF824_08225 [Thermoanaerobaculia bacterium]|jgi:hypothetical protein
MHASHRTLSLVAAAALTSAMGGWWLRGPREVATHDEPRVAAPARAMASEMPRQRLAELRLGGNARERFGRNLFAYREAPPVEPVRIVREPVAAEPPPAAIVDTLSPRPPEAPLFPYRFVGTFGPDADPIAVFTGDGAVVTARRGQRIGGAFAVREVGRGRVEIESADGIESLRLDAPRS